MRRFGFGVAIIAVAAVAGGIVIAQAQTNAPHVIAQRQEMMKANGAAMRSLQPIIRGEAPWNQQTAIQAATTLNTSAKKVVAAFPKGTGPEAGKTDALPTIWQNWADFEAKSKALEAETGKLLQLARDGNESGFKAQFANVGRTCGGCHESFRVKK